VNKEISLNKFIDLQAQDGTYIEAVKVGSEFTLVVHLAGIEQPGVEDDGKPIDPSLGYRFVACGKCMSEAEFIGIVEKLRDDK
jgi:hypothetical protein